MVKKLATWTRTRIGRERVHWVAYDDQPGAADARVVAEGYSTSLVAADADARSALAAEGMHQARRTSKSFSRNVRRAPDQGPGEGRPIHPRPVRVQPRQYFYTRHQDGRDIAAHLILKQTARRVYVTRRSCGPDQLGTEDERWEPNESMIALDRTQLKSDGSAYAKGYRQSAFYPSREAALGDATDDRPLAFARLGIGPPCTIDEIKAAYRIKAFEAHPDRGGNPDDFRVVEAAYRRLLREAQAPEV